MAISRVAGQMLNSTLSRDGVNLAISDTANTTPVLYIDIANSRIGVNTSSANSSLTVAGNAHISNINISGNAISADSGKLNLGSNANVIIGGGSSNYLLQTDGTGNLSWVAGSAITGVYGNNIALGIPTDSSLTDNVAYSGWTANTYVTDSVDNLNQLALNIAKGTFVGQINFSANTTAGPSPMSVAFTGTYVGNANSYLWNFGDGNTANTQNPTHTYSNTTGGQYTVAFTAWNTNGTFTGNSANGAIGSTDTITKTNYITLYTPLPIPSFNTSPTSLDSGSNVTLTNTSQYATSYSINYGDGNIVDPGNSWTTSDHTYIPSANVDTIYGINLTATNETSGPTPPYNVTSANTNVKVYTEQSPAFTANTLTTINYGATSGGVVSFRNDTPGSPGNTASFGAQQKYNYNWGDGNVSNVNIQLGLAGNPSAANITHTFALTPSQQANGNTATFVANLYLYTGYSTSPFESSNVTINIEPEVRANFVGTANTQTDATGFAANAQVGYLYTDYNGLDRSLFNFQNTTSPTVDFTGNIFNWTWGDTTGNANVTSRANISHSYLNDYGSPTTGAKTVALQANGTPGTLSQSNTMTKTSYITILPNPTAPTNLSGFSNVTIANTSQGTSPLLAAGAIDNTGGNIVANGASVTRFITTTNIATSGNVVNANTATTGTLSAIINGTANGTATFTTSGNTVGTNGALVISADRDLHIANAAVPTGFYKVFSANINSTLASLGTGYNDYTLSHTVSGSTNTVGFVKDNLTVVPTLSNTSVSTTETTAGTYQYISGVPYYNTGSPAISISALAVANLSGQTYRNTTTPLTLATGTLLEGTTGTIIASQTKTYAQLDGTPSMLTAGIPNANIGVGSDYTLGNQAVSINGSGRCVATVAATMINVNGSSATIQLPTKIQVYNLAITGINEANIPVSAALGSTYTTNGVRVALGLTGDTPAYPSGVNFYTTDAWTGAETVAGTDEAIVRWGSIQHFVTDLSTGYLPVGPDLATGRAGTQYFTFAFQRTTVANFDIILSGKVSGVWIALPGTQTDTTSTLNGWLDCSVQYAGAGIPGANIVAGGNGSNGTAITGADQIPTGTTVSAARYTQTLGEENMSNSTGNNLLVRIALASGDSLTQVEIGTPT